MKGTVAPSLSSAVTAATWGRGIPSSSARRGAGSKLAAVLIAVCVTRALHACPVLKIVFRQGPSTRQVDQSRTQCFVLARLGDENLIRNELRMARKSECLWYNQN